MKYISVEHVPSRAHKELRELSDSFRFTTELPTIDYLKACTRWPKANQPLRTVLVNVPGSKDRYLTVYVLLNGKYRLDLCKLYLTCDGQELSREETEDTIIRAARFSDVLTYYFRDQYVREPRYCFSEEQAKKDLQDHPQIEALLTTMRKDFNQLPYPCYWSPVPRERKQRAPETYYRKRGEAKVTLVNINAALVETRNTVQELSEKMSHTGGTLLGHTTVLQELRDNVLQMWGRFERVEKCLVALAKIVEKNAGQSTPNVVTSESGSDVNI